MPAVRRHRLKMSAQSPICVIYSMRDGVLHVAAPAERDIGIAFYGDDYAYQRFEMIPAGQERDLDARYAYFAATDIDVSPPYIPGHL